MSKHVQFDGVMYLVQQLAYTMRFLSIFYGGSDILDSTFLAGSPLGTMQIDLQG